ncbi:ABC transporter [Kocuria sp. JC486]|uniref:dynamin family protein n=1 Tax=Kocuria sp. JC486 TaxID=1970736 RepID=UPI00141EFF6C|nr:dynamin family protein [Kocuria sp. JC486]NHU84597.1 ABC transporter [Kocuria sp. JC486]
MPWGRSEEASSETPQTERPDDGTRPIGDDLPTQAEQPDRELGRSHLGAAEATALAVDDLRGLLRQTHLPLETSGAESGRDVVRRTLAQIEDYVLPRVKSLDAPLLAVVGGSTGAGKSTLVNALVGRPVTRAGAVRPTTRQPMLIHHPLDGAAFEGTRVLPHLARVRGQLTGSVGAGGASSGEGPESTGGDTRTNAAEPTHSLVLLADSGMERGIALLDAPDIDSVSEENRRLAAQLLAAADLWLFTTTANRYADAVPWELLVEAGRRDITVAVVLDRVPDGVADEILPDLQRMLTEHGLGEAPVFVIPEAPLNAAGMLPTGTVDRLRTWLADLAADSAARAEVARRTVGGALRQVADRGVDIADDVAEQESVAGQLRADVVEAHERALQEIIASTKDGSLLRDEVLARWQDFVGTGEFFRGLEAQIGRLRDRIGAALRGKPAPEVQVEQALETGLQAVIVEELAKAGENTQRRWRSERAGRSLLGDEDLGRLPDDAQERSAAVIRAWQGDVMELIQQEGAGKRTQARVLSLGLNVVTVALMVTVFSMSAGLTGAEIGIAGASGVVGTKLLEAVFGEDGVRRMADKARRSLEKRLREFVQSLEDPWLERLEILTDPSSGVVREAANRVKTTGDQL